MQIAGTYPMLCVFFDQNGRMRRDAFARQIEAQAETLYREVLPTLSFIMQGLGTLLCYGKLIAALRLGLEPSLPRVPAEVASEQGTLWAHRLAAALGPLPA